MAQLDSAAARAFAHEWIAAWNAHDVERVLAHYAEDVTCASPFIARMGADPSGLLHGKASLRAYWTKALTLLPDLRFELLDVLAGVDSLTLYYRGHRGTVAETVWFDAVGHVRQFTSCYTIDTALTQ